MSNQLKLATNWFGRFAWFVVFSVFLNLKGFAKNLQAKDCASGCSFSGCSEPVSAGFSTGSDLFRLILLAVLLFLLAFYFHGKYKARRIYWIITTLVAISMVAVIAFQTQKAGQQPESCQTESSPVIGVLHDTAVNSEFLPMHEDFEPLSGVVTEQTGSVDAPDAMQETISDTALISANDEFAPIDDEFAATEFQTGENTAAASEKSGRTMSQADKRFLIELAILFSVLIVISFFIKNESFRKFRGLFLLATVVYLGFIKGGCPCMILSFQNLVLAGLGQQVAWISLIWFVALVPLTYFFGKIWCSWLCHLGGLQEFLFQADKLHILKSLKAQAFLRYLRIVVLVILIAQLTITQTNIFIHYDPFKMAFNLFSANTTGYVLLVILLLLSVMIYRPFCRGFCPVGVVLAGVSHLPGAKNITKTQNCADCKRCSDACKTHAIVYESGSSHLNIHDCIFCGDCIGSCKKNSITIS